MASANPLTKSNWLTSFTVAFIVIFGFKFGQALFIVEDYPIWGCLPGWIGEIPQNMTHVGDHLLECGKDRTMQSECKRHCLAKKMGLILEGRIWLYKLVVILKQLFPGPTGKESVDKMTDIILECSDKHFKTYGLLSQHHCYREKPMWHCILRAAETVCRLNRHRMDGFKDDDSSNMMDPKTHRDVLVEEGRHEHPHPGGGGEKFTLTKKTMVLTDY